MPWRSRSLGYAGPALPHVLQQFVDEADVCMGQVKALNLGMDDSQGAQSTSSPEPTPKGKLCNTVHYSSSIAAASKEHENLSGSEALGARSPKPMPPELAGSTALPSQCVDVLSSCCSRDGAELGLLLS